MRRIARGLFWAALTVLAVGLTVTDPSIARGASPFRARKALDSRLIVAIGNRSESGVEQLLRLGADPNCKDGQGQTALILALMSGVHGKALLQFGLQERGHEIANALLGGGALVNGRNSRGVTALMWMSHMQSLSDVKFLLGKGASATFTDYAGNSALHYAVMNYDRYLPDTADVSRKRLVNECSLVRLLIEHGVSVDVANKVGVTPLMLASLVANADVVDLLIGLGANVSRASKTGVTALMDAIETTDPTTVRELLVRGANPNQTAPTFAPPLFLAVGYDQINIVQLLLQYGADPTRKFVVRGSALTALEFAEQNKLADMVRVLGPAR